jgi:transposase
VGVVQREVVGALSHAELVELVLRQYEALERTQAALAEAEALIARLEARVRELETRLGLRSSGKGSASPQPQGRPRPKKPRKRRAHGFSRLRSVPTRRVIHALEYCPDCAAPLAGGSVKWTREVIELQPAPAEVIEHVYLERRCIRCGRRVVPPATAVGVVAGRQRLGVELTTLLAVLRQVGRLPIRTIQWYLQTFHQLHLSVGSIVAAVDRVAQRAEPLEAQIRQRVRASPLVHADETHWRENGASGFIWTFSTSTERYYVRRDRTKSVVDEVLGDSTQTDAFSGVLCTDFYAAYHHYPGLKQRCWAHLLRAMHELKVEYPHMPSSSVGRPRSTVCTPEPSASSRPRKLSESAPKSASSSDSWGCASRSRLMHRPRSADCARASNATSRSCSCSCWILECRPTTMPPSAACDRW